MRIFVYEFVTGGGFLTMPGAPFPERSLKYEGGAMARALAEDFLAVPGCQVVLMRDERMAGCLSAQGAGAETVGVADGAAHEAAFQRLVLMSDWTVVIAPEFDGHLTRLTRRVRDIGGRLLGPGPAIVAWASDKQQTASRLQRLGIPCPAGAVVTGREMARPSLLGRLGIDWPAVAKPLCGAGSLETRRLVTPGDAASKPWNAAETYRVETEVPGRAASVALLLGTGRPTVLAPCWQILSRDGAYQYRGGALIRDAGVVGRLRQLAEQVAPLLADARGYVGIDFVVGADVVGAEVVGAGAAADGAARTARDWVIEINPRLTTSYVGLRQATATNLAQAMLDLAVGKEVELVWAARDITWRTEV